MFAAPTQHSMQARRIPSRLADSTACSDTGPPIWMPEYQLGIGSCGSRNKMTSPGATALSNTTRNSTLIAITVSASTR